MKTIKEGAVALILTLMVGVGYGQNYPNQGYDRQYGQSYDPAYPNQGYNQPYNQGYPNQGCGQNYPNQGYYGPNYNQGYGQNYPNQGYGYGPSQPRVIIVPQPVYVPRPPVYVVPAPIIVQRPRIYGGYGGGWGHRGGYGRRW